MGETPGKEEKAKVGPSPLKKIYVIVHKKTRQKQVK